jgi:hypothetical protein
VRATKGGAHAIVEVEPEPVPQLPGPERAVSAGGRRRVVTGR